MTAAQEAHSRYVDEYPQFTAAADALKERLELLCREVGVTGTVDARPKTIASFVKKSHSKAKSYTDPWSEITDKVGGRIVADSPAALRTLRSSLDEPVAADLEARGVHDKADGESEKRLYYPGIHAQVTVPGVTTSDGQPIEAEIQLRTRAQDLWSVASHKLDYKGVIPLSREARRRVWRLSVLTEMFDEEVDRVMNELAADPAYMDARYLQLAEAEYLRFVPEPGNDELSLAAIAEIRAALLENATPPEIYGEVLHDFAVAHEQKLTRVYDKYGANSAWAGDFLYWMFSQPESVMVFHLIEERPQVLYDAIAGSDIESAVAELYDAWGTAWPGQG